MTEADLLILKLLLQDAEANDTCIPNPEEVVK